MTSIEQLKVIAPMLFGLAAHYAYGSLFVKQGFFTRCLVGLSMSALVVGILANLAASLIHGFLQVSVTLGSVLSAVVLIRLGKSWRFSWDRGAPLLAALIIGFAVFALNDPAKHFVIADKESDDLYLKFNPHYSYFSSQSSEMLAADYPSRLKLQSQWPLEWSAYHFFASGAIATIQTFSEPNLVGYFYAQLVIFIALVLSFREIYVGRHGDVWHHLIFVAWLVTGFALFAGSIRWQLYSNSAISLWAAVMLFVSLYDDKRREAFFALTILGLSSTRMVPVAVAVFVIIWLVDRKGRRFYRAVSTNPRSLCLYVLAAVYLSLTVFSAPPPQWATFFNRGALDATWQHLLVLYRATGFSLDGLIQRPLPQYAHGGNYLDFFANAQLWIPSQLFWAAAVALGGAALYVLALGNLVRLRSQLLGVRPWRRFVPLALSCFVVLWLLERLHGTLVFVFLFVFVSYILLTTTIASRLENKRFVLILGWTMAAVVLYLLTGSNQIKGPVAYSMIEAPLWTVAGLVMMRRRFPVWACALVVAAWLLFPPHLRGVGVMDSAIVVAVPGDGILDRPAIRAALRRESAAGRCNARIDAYAALLGERMPYDDTTKCFVARDFVIER